MQKGRMYGIGVLLTLIGGAGLAEISTSNHGCFVFCAILFASGFSLCVGSYIR